MHNATLFARVVVPGDRAAALPAGIDRSGHRFSLRHSRAPRSRRVGKANGSRECAPDDRLRVPTVQGAFGETVGTARCAFAHPTNSPSLRVGASRPGMTNGDMTQKCMPHQRNLPVVPICRGLLQLISPPNQWFPWLVSFPIEGRLAIVTDVGSGMRWTHIAERNDCATNGGCADGEVVWSWRSDAGAKVVKTLPASHG